MNRFKALLFLLFTLGNLVAHTQTTGDDEYEYKPKKVTNARKNKKAVIKAIRQLKSGGAVLVMVKDVKVNAEMLKKRGMESRAADIEKKQMDKNLVIVRGFAKAFRFCPVYFFLQSDIKQIQDGQITGNLLDTNLVKSPSITFNHNYFLIIDYGDVYEEHGKVYNDTTASDVTGLPSLKDDCFIFKNKYLSQLTKPFPYFYTCHYPTKEILIKIKKMNQHLGKFYHKHSEE